VSDAALVKRVSEERDQLMADAEKDYRLGRGDAPVSAKASTVNDKSIG
jgi:hypothetical protein